MSVRAHGGDALIERVVLVLEHAHERLAQASVVLLLAHLLVVGM